MEINTGRWTARIDGDFVVFLIGTDVRDPERASRAAGLLMAMADMLGELAQDPARACSQVWREWNRLAEDERSGAGIWHETFLVPAGRYEAIYQNMPLTGLQNAGTAITVSEARSSARQRLRA